MQRKGKKSGFTLLEILLVVAAIAILAGIVILAINPTKQLGDTRNAQRRADVTTISNAVYQYAIDNSGDLPGGTGGIPTDSTEICSLKGAGDETTCTDDGYVWLGDLVGTGETYIVAIPTDPSDDGADNGSGYFIKRSSNKRITVNAPSAEQGATISVTR